MLIVVGGIAAFLFAGQPKEPMLAYHDGVPSEIWNCEQTAARQQYRCAALYCEKALYERKLVQPYTPVSIPKHWYNFSDAPDRSVHFATWMQEGKPVIAKCEMKGLDVVSIELLEKMPQ